MRKSNAFAIIAVVSLVGTRVVWAAQDEAQKQAELAKALALKDAKVSLGKGLSASEREGKPISAKYEVEEGLDPNEVQLLPRELT